MNGYELMCQVSLRSHGDVQNLKHNQSDLHPDIVLNCQLQNKYLNAR